MAEEVEIEVRFVMLKMCIAHVTILLFLLLLLLFLFFFCDDMIHTTKAQKDVVYILHAIAPQHAIIR